MRLTWGKRFISAAAAAGLLTLSIASAQQAVVEEGKRKIKTRNNPQYSEIAKRMGLTGKVRVEIVIAADGHVKSSRAIGGHPVLVQSCLDAVKDWKFEPASEESTQILEFDFKQ
jgi:TonB family protein